jgi:hypothetical protein
VRGDTTPAPETTAGGQGPRPVVENRSPGGTNTVGGPKSTTGDLPRATRSAYRKDAESLTDTGFERISDSVRAAAVADPAAGYKLDRGLVRAAGAVEAAGGDPGDLQVAEAKKREMSAARRRSAADEGAGDVPPCYVSPRIIASVRQILGDRIDLDPASAAAHNGHARARVFHDGTDASRPGLEAAWPKDAGVWLHVPRGADAAVFVQRVLSHAEAGAPVLVLMDSMSSHLPSTQAVLQAATAICFIAADGTEEHPRTDTTVDEGPVAAGQGQVLVGLNVSCKAFKEGCARLGVSFARGKDEDEPAGFLGRIFRAG